ncbi:MAG: branched-chain amino acid transport system substrate-binding protein [Solirubrobacteraceae bacterium]|nr:branched-chain amino acid transport system substrate-binding protein [Solirubrobacteraceae bacterium]
MAAFGLSACGSKKSSSSGSSGSSNSNELHIYSSLPLQGASRGQNLDVQNGMKLALADAGGKAGKFTVKYTSLDDSTASAGQADDATVGSNARKAVADPQTVAYLGDFNSSATKVSLPILNKAGIAQISPSNTNVGLTTSKPGGDPGAPDIYYPTGKRNYARVVPTDDVQGAAIVTAAKADGCKSIHVWNDKQTYGTGLAQNIVLAAKKQGVAIEGNDPTDANVPNYRSLASKIKTNCFAFAGITAQNAVQIFKDVYAHIGPSAKMYGGDGITDKTFVDPKQKGIPASIGAHVKITQAGLPADKQPPSGQAVYKRFSKTYHESNPDAYSIYGYEVMALALDAIKRAGDKGNDRAAVVQALFNTKSRNSVLGTYSLDPNGDTSLKAMGLYVIKGGALKLDKVIKFTG